MPRILIGALFQETNDFHPNDTLYEDFNILRGDELFKDRDGVVGGAVDIFSEREGLELSLIHI